MKHFANTVQKTIGVIAAAVLTGLVAAPAAFAQQNNVSETGARNLERLNSCIATKKKADIIFVIDESASLRGHNGGPASDPKNIRVAAVEDLVAQLGKSAADIDADINVKLAGFGEGYRSNPETYGEWTNVSENPAALDTAISGFENRNNDLYTNYGVALSGALADIAAQPDPDSCRSILFFTDGLLTVPGDSQADIAAREAVCSGDGVVSKTRDAGVHLFTVGLIPEGEDSPEQLLRSMAEGSDCAAGQEPNGAFFNAESNPAGLFAAFRSLLPDSASVEHRGDTQSQLTFVLDNSITEVRISSQPEEVVADGTLIPILITPGGQTLELTTPKHTVNGATIETELGASVPGMVDIAMEKTKTDDWAGQWAFGYKTTGEKNTYYSAKMQIFPGLNTVVKELSNTKTVGLSTNDTIHATLVDRHGQPRALDGEASISAQFVPAAGAPVAMGQPQSIINGESVEFALAEVAEPTTGEIVLSTTITTQGIKETPGTELSPVVARYPIVISPAYLPKAPRTVNFAVEEKETTITIPVEGPGKLWVDPAGIKENMTVPDNVGAVNVAAKHNSVDSALLLKEGDRGELPITITVDSLRDGPLAFDALVKMMALEDNASGEVSVDMRGSMRAPVNPPVFVAVLIIAILLGILIPLAILYIIKHVTGVLAGTKLHGYSFPITRTPDGAVVREDTGGRVQLDYQSVVLNTTGVTPQPRRVVLAGKEITVGRDLNPFTAAYAVTVDSPAIASSGKQIGEAAQLPLALRGNWVLFGNAHDENRGHILVIVDHNISDEELQRISQDITEKVPDFLEKLSLAVPSVVSDATDGQNPAQTDPFGDGGTIRSGGVVTHHTGTGGSMDTAGDRNGPYGGSHGLGTQRPQSEIPDTSNPVIKPQDPPLGGARDPFAD